MTDALQAGQENGSRACFGRPGAVSRVVSGASDGTIRVGFSFDASAAYANISAAFHGMGDRLLFLHTGSPVFDYDPSL